MNVEVVILAAGLGTRMKSGLPKVLHPVCGKPMLVLLLEQLEKTAQSKKSTAQISVINIVVGYGRDQVMTIIKELQRTLAIKTPIVFTIQEPQLGTGHAVKLALQTKTQSTAAQTVAVLNGDLPLFTADAWEEYLSSYVKKKVQAMLASVIVKDPGEYGRIIRKGKNLMGVVEYDDATTGQRKICEVNAGVYLFERALLEKALASIKNQNASHEFYLPDVFSFAKKSKKKIDAHIFKDPIVLSGVNTMEELARAQKALYLKTAKKWMDQGVFIEEPSFTYIDPGVKIGKNVRIGAFTRIVGESIIGDDVQIEAFCCLKDVKVGDGSILRQSTVAEKAIIGKQCTIGPMAHLRPGTILSDYVRIGNFVEVKESKIGTHTTAAHLSYIGDAEIGSQVNLGCGFITCNYDGTIKEGKRKHRTVIGDNVFVGSDSQVVAPIKITEGTYIASGSTVTASVKDPDSLVIARSQQVTKPGYAKKYRKK